MAKSLIKTAQRDGPTVDRSSQLPGDELGDGLE